MNFRSILFASTEDAVKAENASAPAFFVDLNLDQVVDAITHDWTEYDLQPFYHSPLTDVAAITYRQEIAQDLENEFLFESIRSFSGKMITVRRYLVLVSKLYTKNHKEGWFLEAIDVYCEAVRSLAHDLNLVELSSRGLLAFRAYVTDYPNSDTFTSLATATRKLKDELYSISYSVTIKDSTVSVRKHEGEIDYSVEVEKTFQKFKQGAVKDYKVKLYDGGGMNHIEAQILDCVAKLYPDLFSRLDQHCALHIDFVDETIRVFDREVQFYIAYFEYIARMKRAGLKFCYPQVSDVSKEVYDYEGFDLALAHKLTGAGAPIVTNDFHLSGAERIIVVTGPNQGGKTTFARTFGQLHYLASIGCPVPGREARLYLFDNIFAHFEKQENIENLRGKLEDDLFRIHSILAKATPQSIIIMNEIFTSTTLQDSIFLSRQIMEKIIQLDLLCVFVTFIDELTTLSEKTVSMVSTVVPENPAARTFKIVRKPADGLAYALSIAEKHRVTYDDLKERIKS